MDDLMLSQRAKPCQCEATILIVDDNMFNLIPLELILKEMFQLTCDKAMNGKDAVTMYTNNILKKCCNVRYKLVLMDLNMPIMDGYQASILIQAQFKREFRDLQYPNGDKLYIVAITAFVNEENI